MNKETECTGGERPDLRFLLRKSLKLYPARDHREPTLMDGDPCAGTEATVSAVLVRGIEASQRLAGHGSGANSAVHLAETKNKPYFHCAPRVG